LLAAVMTMAIGPAAWAGLTPSEVEGGAGDQVFGQFNTSWEVWTSNSTHHPDTYNAYGKTTGDPRFRVNAAGTRGFTGNLLDDTSQTIFQQADGPSSDIYLYDLSTKTRTSPGSGVNSKLWEWAPTVSAGFVLFGRNSFRKSDSPWKVILYDRTAHTFKVLDSVTNHCGCIYPGSVTDQYATWTKCAGSTCQSWYYDVAGGGTARVPNALDRHQYYPAASTETGDLYLVRSNNFCANTQIIRWNPVAGGDPTVITTLPDGFDVAVSVRVTDDPGGHQDVYFDRQSCSGNFYSDVYKLEDADLVTLTRGGAGSSATRRMVLPAPGARPSR
jgi:hypothetical protein